MTQPKMNSCQALTQGLRRAICCLLPFLIASPALAAGFITGQWQGPGTSQIRGEKSECTEINVQISALDEKNVRLDKVDFKCTGLRFQIKPLPLTVESGELKYKDSVVGKIGPESLQMAGVLSGRGYRLELHKNPDGTVRIKNALELYKDQFYEVEGQLNPL